MKRELLRTTWALLGSFIMIGVQCYLGNELRGIDGFYIYALFYLMFKK